MTLSIPRVQHYLKSFKLEKLFIEELGWDRHSGKIQSDVDGKSYSLTALAEKRGVQIFQCRSENGNDIPDYATRRKIEKQVTKSAYEHLIIFIDTAQTIQIWQWVSRQPGLRAAYREHHYHPKHQSGDSIVQKLQSITFSLSEEEGLALTGVAFKLRDAFDRDKITKKFYDYFKKQHTTFLGFIQGITQQGDREWYASLMLNRLMFIYFIQRKGFLDGDSDYLKNRLKIIQKRKGKGKFLSFYRYFLLRLFHEGFSQQPKQRKEDLQDLLGKIPYLNGGLFELHELEREYPKIDIPDESFEKLFAFFDQYEWHLDNRPLRNDNEINPDVLGYIFEKYINQKQMGAYYTKEDITEYISKNTVIPCLFNSAMKKCAVAFQPDASLWGLLKSAPLRYIYPAVTKGVIDTNGDVIPLPGEIAKGIEDVTKREGWNAPADAKYALPTETWREHVARRQRCLGLIDQLKNGKIYQINDLITYNLDIRQFAEDAITECDGPELLKAFYQSISAVTVLDPTCGSGAFLFAALNILEPLYDACLDRMQGFIDDLERSGKRYRSDKFSNFRRFLNEIEKHPNRHFFILKSIVINNLYGVDIMEEAVEICKLRLFLKLVAQVDKVKQLEPLPDIDFNIRAGNTLVGFVTRNEVRQAAQLKPAGKHQQGKLPFTDTQDEVQRIEENAEIAERAFRRFHEMQTKYKMDARQFKEAKEALREILKKLSDRLNQYLAKEYGINLKKNKEFEKWRESHLPFHWFVEFYGIMSRGGFDVIIGNPPYVAARKVRNSYEVVNLKTVGCPDIYAWVLERGRILLRTNGRTGMIVPLSLGFSSDFDSCRQLLFSGYNSNWFSSFGRIPSALFSFDVRVRNTIHIAHKSRKPFQAHTTRLHRWFEAERSTLFQMIEYAMFQPVLWKYRVPKLNTTALAQAFERAFAANTCQLSSITSRRPTNHVLNFKKTAYNWLNFCRKIPPCYKGSRQVSQTQFDSLYLQDAATRDILELFCNEKLMLTFWFVVGDDFHVTRWSFGDFPADMSILSKRHNTKLRGLVSELEQSMEAALQFKLNAGRRVGNYNLAKCRSVTDISDSILAEALGYEDVLEDIELYYIQAVKTDFS